MKRILTYFSILLVLLMNTSQPGIARIKAFEGFRSKAYPDGFAGTAQKYSIGYGHSITIGETSLRSQTITTAIGEQLMRSDISPLEIQINRDLKVQPTQNQFDALISFAYNTGSGSLSKIITTWNSSHNINDVTERMLLYNKVTDKAGNFVVSDTLKNRRLKEVSVFNSSLPPVGIRTGLLAVAGICLGIYLFS